MGRAALTVAAALSALLSAGRARAGTLFVSLPQDARPCDFDQLALALHAHVPGAVIVAGVGEARSGDVALAFTVGGDTWKLAVSAPGAAELRRELPAPGTECAALAETSALIVERYLESIAWTPDPAVVTPLPPPPPPLPWQLAVNLGVGGYLGRALAAPVGALDVGVRHGRWELTAGAASPLLGRAFGEVDLTTFSTLPDQPTNGALEPWLVALDVALAYRVPLPFGAIALGLEPGVEVWGEVPHSTTSVPLASTAASLAVSPDLGLSATLEIRLTKRLSLGIRARGRAMGMQTTFAASGEDGRLVTPWVDGDATLGVRALLF